MKFLRSGNYLTILWWDNMKSFREFIDEEIKLPIEVGDIVLGGKFKNKRIIVKDIGENEKGDITINGKPILRVRITGEKEENGAE